MAELAARLEPGHRYDSIVVDEAQDFADAWWDPLLAALKDDEAGGLYVFSDEGQRVFNRHGSSPVPLVPLPHQLPGTYTLILSAARASGLANSFRTPMFTPMNHVSAYVRQCSLAA
jgi:hypothetical protein